MGYAGWVEGMGGGGDHCGLILNGERRENVVGEGLNEGSVNDAVGLVEEVSREMHVIGSRACDRAGKLVHNVLESISRSVGDAREVVDVDQNLSPPKG
mmetsp:Transcript_16175/g.32786  ORF Transcript_16175/g.32786 Transcript_16175/m.32786 type:complete len:98 (-) Transcript_16175:1067-1360(-)|eukprot:CAMPEP_0184677626 /NCGR_PEP_ID=MMETSP0312-20130426/206_1 /TAXON_ID=31354 /ORGANISM="Compsopogon coeruleus, Strain SAG 36.94" /LENGTH=97 /DNA_ID=CAMNT_0027125599 /DNA_START=150 /DNA_END=443 /DNA_ORIENTATION=-